MSHSNELDNGITIIANGSDLSGDVIFVLPDGRRIETTWDKALASSEMYEVLNTIVKYHVLQMLTGGAEFERKVSRLLAKARGILKLAPVAYRCCECGYEMTQEQWEAHCFEEGQHLKELMIGVDEDSKCPECGDTMEDV